MKIILVAMALVVAAAGANAQTEVQGTIDGQTWTSAGSPYILVGNLEVASLTVEPGVSVQANAGFEILVTGYINAVGTELSPILFTAASGAASWGGFRYNNVTSAQSHFMYCQIEKSASRGFDILNSLPPIMEHCTLSSNSGSSGGAVYIENATLTGTSFAISDCAFSGNTSSGHGGALHIRLASGELSILRSSFTANIANSVNAVGNFVGGALYLQDGSANIAITTFATNQSRSRCASTFDCAVLARGGAIFTSSAGSVRIVNCEFDGNIATATNNGNCFYGGSSLSHGGGIYVSGGSVDLLNCSMHDNSTARTNCGPADGGGGVYVNAGTARLVNCTVVDNPDATGIHRAGGTLEATNSIIFFNDGGATQIGGTCTVTNSDVQGGYAGAGNITGNPSFLDDEYSLSSVSPCVDAGSPALDSYDTCFPPSRGGLRNDMGYTGGPGALDPQLPLIDVADVPSDQGDALRVSWQRFPADAAGAITPITAYQVQRAPSPFFAPVTAWSAVVEIPAAESENYTVDVATAESYVVDEHWPYYVYRVVGLTADQGITYPSNSNIGMAIDNIVPPAPQLALIDNPGARSVVMVPLDVTGVPDYKEACVYRGWLPAMMTFGRDTTAVRWDTAVDCSDRVTPVDACLAGAGVHMWCDEYQHQFYYLARSRDTHGNLSLASNRVSGLYPSDVLVPPVPAAFELLGAHPNPFNPSTTISYALPREEKVTVRIYSLAGRLVKELVQSVLPAGRHEVEWRGRDDEGRAVASGVYVCQVNAESGSGSMRVLLLK